MSDVLTHKERRKQRKVDKEKGAELGGERRLEESDVSAPETAKALPAGREADGAEPLTHKERRKARKAENAKRAELGDKRSEKSIAGTPEATEALPADAEADDEEPLSHKERRKRRKLEKQATERGDIEAPLPARAEEPHRSAFCVWIGNLSFRISVDELKTWLAEHGVEGVSRVNMPRGARRDEENKG